MPREIQVKTILNKTRKRGTWFLDDYTINPYSGCSFNCLFCYIRGSRFGVHMEEKMSVKSNLASVLDRQLSSRAKKNQQGFVVVSSATDPYVHFELTQLRTRTALELLSKYRFPVHIITRSPLVLRDIDLLERIQANSVLPEDLRGRIDHKVIISFSFSSTSERIAKIFEPGAPSPSERLIAMKELADRGFHTGVSLMPMLPYISDQIDHWREMLEEFRNAGAKYVLPATLTLFGSSGTDSKQLIFRAIEKNFPHLVEKYHHFFMHADEMPAYYRKAFYRKASELCREFGLHQSIMPK